MTPRTSSRGSESKKAPIPSAKATARAAQKTGRERRVPESRLVRDLMTEKVYSLSPGDDLATLYDLMDFRRIRHVPVVEEGELVGLVTGAELSRGAFGGPELPLSAVRDRLRRLRVRDIMATEPDTIEPDQSLLEAAEILFDVKVGCLPVVEGVQLVGILTEADFVRDFVRREGASS